MSWNAKLQFSDESNIFAGHERLKGLLKETEVQNQANTSSITNVFLGFL